MRTFSFLCLPILLMMLFALGCSSSPGDPAGVLPTEQPPERLSQPADEGHVLMGVYSLDIDIESNSIDIVSNRSGEKHWNVTPFLFPPNCPDCFVTSITGVDPLAREVDVKLTLKNPTFLTGYDVRGIIFDFDPMTLQNPDAYTKLFGPGTINPFIAWITNVDRAFHSMQVHDEDITIHNPSWPLFPPFSFVIEASWAGHCKDPYNVSPFSIGEDLQSDGSNSVYVNVYVQDWQGDIESVTIDLTPIGGLFNTPMDDVGGGYYQKEISYISGPGEGYYDLLITATTAADIANKTTYHYATAHVVGAGSEFPVEFDDEERISYTSGQSFIWPKHAMAVDSSGNPHMVWSDNNPDPLNHIFKVYYSKRTTGIWEPPTIVGSSGVDVIYATMCIDEDDVVHIIWEDQRAGEMSTDIYYTSSDSGFATEDKLTDAPTQVRYAFPRCAVDDDGLVHLVWHDNIGDSNWDVNYMTYDPDTGTTDNEMAVEATPGVFEGYPAIDIDAEGDVHVAYQQDNGTMQIFHKEKPYTTFTSAHMVANDVAYQPSIHCGNSPDEVFVTYFDYTDGSYCDVYAAISINGGTNFNDTKVSTSDTEYQIHPDIAQGWNGDVYVIWTEEGYIDVDGTPGPDDLNGDDVINQDDAVPHRTYFRQMSGTSLDPVITLVSGDYSSAFPQIAVDANHFVHVSYMKWTVEVPYNNYELYYRRSLPWG